MTILEIKERKNKLRDEITAAVIRFEKETSAEVTAIIPRRGINFRLAKAEVTHPVIAVDVEVRV